ncbi:MAG: LptE family protein [Gemmatimonadota bacterium]
MPRPGLAAARWAATILLAGGCAHYSTSSGLVGGIRTVAIPVAENDTATPEVAEALTVRLADAFAADGRLRVVDEDRADAVLQVTVTEVEDQPFTFTAGEQTQQYRFRVFVDADLARAEDEGRLLELRRLTGWGTYDATAADTDSLGREPAIRAALDIVVEEIVDRTTASW